MARIVITVVVVAIFGVGIFAIWAWLGGDDDSPQLTPLQLLLVERAVADVTTSLTEKELPKGVDTLTEPILTGKLGPEVAKLLRPALLERKWNLVEANTFKKDHPSLSRWVETVFGDSAGKWADERWKENGVHGFVRGSAEFKDVDGSTVLELKVRVEDSGTEAPLLQASGSEAITRSIFNLDYYRLSIDEMGVGWRLLLWLFGLLLLPLLCYSVAVKGLAASSNATNLTLWLGLTFVDMLGASALMGFRAPGFFGSIGLLVALALALFYNYAMLTEIDDLRK